MMKPKRIFWKDCVEKCLEKINDNRWKDVNVVRDILTIFRDEFNALILPYVCVLGIYTVWLLLLMLCNTFLLWSILHNNSVVLFSQTS